MTTRDYTLPAHLLAPTAATVTCARCGTTTPRTQGAYETFCSAQCRERDRKRRRRQRKAVEATQRPVAPPTKGWRDPAYLELLDECWRPAPPLPGATGNTIGENGKDHPRYHAAVRREARRRRDASVGRGWYA